LHERPCPLEARRGHAGCRVFLKTLAEGAALAPVERKHRAIERDAGERAVDHVARDAGGRGFARHGGQERVEIATALRRSGRRCEQQTPENDGDRSKPHACPHGEPFHRTPSHPNPGRGTWLIKVCAKPPSTTISCPVT